jgi:glucokinase
VPLEDMISGHAIARRATSHAGPDQPMAAADVFEASTDDPGLDGLVTDFVTELAFHVVNLAICLNPVRIAVGGGMVRSWDRLRPGLQRALTVGVPFPPELVAARFPSDAPLIGAVALAVDAAQGGHGSADGTVDAAGAAGVHDPQVTSLL